MPCTLSWKLKIFARPQNQDPVWLFSGCGEELQITTGVATSKLVFSDNAIYY